MNSLLHSSRPSTEVLSLTNLKDAELLSSTKMLVQREREITTQVLRHLAEIERRKLYCDLKCASLFEYAVRELKYSEGAAARRIQAMRLIAEIPELESKIESGALNLTNICSAQNFFREQKKAQPEQILGKDQKREILERLEQKSSREGERILLEIGGPQALPRERERLVTPELVELSFLASQELKDKLESVRALLGPCGAQMNLAELVAEMASLSTEKLSERKFGKRRIQAQATQKSSAEQMHSCVTFTPDAGVVSAKVQQSSHSGAGDRRSWRSRVNSRYIPQAAKLQVWQVADGKCSCCGSQRDLQFDHIQPFALGGASRVENLQLLCRSCNLRRGVQSFGVQLMRRASRVASS